MAHCLTLPTGRHLTYQINGSSSPPATPLFFNNGTPNSCLVTPSFAALCKARDIKLITISRPGYADSGRNQGRGVLDDMRDIEALKAHLGVQKFLVGGWSGGGESIHDDGE